MSAKELVRNALVRTLAPVAERAHRERPRARVLSFHDVPEALRDEFARKLQWLARAYRVVPLAAIHARTGLDESPLNVALTFDDGFREHATFVAPLLRRLGLPATFFVPSGAIGLVGGEAEAFSRTRLRRRGRFEFVDEEEVRALATDPLFEVGGHTRTHADLSEGDDPWALAAEIGGDKAALERLTGRELRWFAFPFGGAAQAAPGPVRAIREADYLAAFTIVPSFWSRDRDPYRVGRDCLDLGVDLRLWSSWMRGGYDWPSRLKVLGRL